MGGGLVRGFYFFFQPNIAEGNNLFSARHCLRDRDHTLGQDPGARSDALQCPCLPGRVALGVEPVY